MSLKLDLQKLLQKEIQQSQPLIDTDEVKEEFLAWLAEVKFPAYPDAKSWEECLQVFPPDPEEKQLDSGRRIRLALRLYTRENQYLVMLSENLAPESRGVYSLSVHVNWRDKEKHLQRLVEETYTGHFEDSLRSKHTLWAQTVRVEDIQDALGNCATAILGNELVGRKESKIDKTTINKPQQTKLHFPEE
ncbi:MAG: hypothetical protein JXA92_09655, partial [candidate division Zixibacteria bacterium]|nr:hypothetical protein [candidate division Zixibacteria bacterium]